MAQIINMNQDFVFEVNFNFQRNNKYICDRLGLTEVLNQYDQNGIQSIKLFDGKAFKRVSKKRILEILSWDTKQVEYLSKHYYFN